MKVLDPLSRENIHTHRHSVLYTAWEASKESQPLPGRVGLGAVDSSWRESSRQPFLPWLQQSETDPSTFPLKLK